MTIDISNIFQNITLILPTLNNIDCIDKHLNSLKPIIGYFGNIIAVDSYSNDGTYERLLESLPKTAFIYQRERGLYQAWNDAISKATNPYCYISTIGDTPNTDKLFQLAKFVMENDIDLCISPPHFQYEEHQKEPASQWPIHSLIAALNINEPLITDKHTSALIQCYSSSFRPQSSLSGSFASNLCKTSILKKHPFPTEFSGAGDVAWMAVISSEINLGVYPHEVASFLIHEKKYPELTGRQSQDLAQKVFQHNKPNIPITNLIAQQVEQLSAIKQKMRMLKQKNGLLRFLTYDYWHYKSSRKNIRLRLSQSQLILLKLIKANIKSV